MATLQEAFRAALAHHQAGRLGQAERLYDQILLAQPDHSQSLHLKGVAAHQTGRHAEAVELIERAVALRSDQAAWFGNLGTARSALGRFDDAISAYHRALELDQNNVEARYNLASVLSQTGDAATAADAYRQALQINPQHVGSLNNLGTTLRELGCGDEAICVLQRAVDVAPGFVESRYNLGNVLRDAGQVTEAESCFRSALELQPDSARIHAGLAITQLLQGNFASGWAEYEWRLHCETGRVSPRCTPVWDGTNPAGRRIMLFAEQGLGDTIQFVRFANSLKEFGATVFIECQPPLVPLLANAAGLDGVFARDDRLPEFDVAVPLLSVPHRLNTSVDSIPADVPYLAASDELTDHWARHLAPIESLKIGIAWQGAAGHLDDNRRSIPLTAFAPLSRIDGVTLISLQKGHGIEQLDAGSLDFDVVRLPDDVDTTNGAFMDTAAIMQQLDLVVTSDTAIAHLAGALGVRAWIALSTGPDWRWLMDRDDSPWYPSARLFRQQSPGDWDDVFARMAGQLASQVQS